MSECEFIDNTLYNLVVSMGNSIMIMVIAIIIVGSHHVNSDVRVVLVCSFPVVVFAFSWLACNA